MAESDILRERQLRNEYMQGLRDRIQMQGNAKTSPGMTNAQRANLDPVDPDMRAVENRRRTNRAMRQRLNAQTREAAQIRAENARAEGIARANAARDPNAPRRSLGETVRRTANQAQRQARSTLSSAQQRALDAARQAGNAAGQTVRNVTEGYSAGRGPTSPAASASPSAGSRAGATVRSGLSRAANSRAGQAAGKFASRLGRAAMFPVKHPLVTAGLFAAPYAIDLYNRIAGNGQPAADGTQPPAPGTTPRGPNNVVPTAEVSSAGTVQPVGPSADLPFGRTPENQAAIDANVAAINAETDAIRDLREVRSGRNNGLTPQQDQIMRLASQMRYGNIGDTQRNRTIQRQIDALQGIDTTNAGREAAVRRNQVARAALSAQQAKIAADLEAQGIENANEMAKLMYDENGRRIFGQNVLNQLAAGIDTPSARAGLTQLANTAMSRNDNPIDWLTRTLYGDSNRFADPNFSFEGLSEDQGLRTILPFFGDNLVGPQGQRVYRDELPPEVYDALRRYGNIDSGR